MAWEDPLKKGVATHSSVLAWRIPRTEEPGRLILIITATLLKIIIILQMEKLRLILSKLLAKINTASLWLQRDSSHHLSNSKVLVISPKLLHQINLAVRKYSQIKNLHQCFQNFSVLYFYLHDFVISARVVFAYTFLSMKLPLTCLFFNKIIAIGLKNHYYLL